MADLSNYIFVNGNTANFGGNTSVTNLSITGNIVYAPVFGQFYNTANQSPAANTATQITLSNAAGNSTGVSFNTDGNITIQHAGIYQLSTSIQVGRSGGGATEANVYVWFRQNGVDISNSGFSQIVDKLSQTITTATWVANVTANSNISIIWAQDDSIILQSFAANAGGFTHPAVPSATVTVTPSGA